MFSSEEGQRDAAAMSQVPLDEGPHTGGCALGLVHDLHVGLTLPVGYQQLRRKFFSKGVEPLIVSVP